MLARPKEAYPFQVECAERSSCALASSRAGRDGIGHWSRRPSGGRVGGTRLGQSGGITDHHRHARLSSEPQSLAAPVLAVGAIAVSAQYQWLAVARRRSQRLALVERVPPPSRRDGPCFRKRPNADLAGVAVAPAAGGARSYPRLARSHHCSRRYGSCGRLSPFAGLGPDRSPAGNIRTSPPHKLASRLAAAGPHLGGELLGDFGGEHVGARHLRR